MRKRYLYIFAALVLTYVTLTFSLPTDPSVLTKYDFTQAKAQLINLSVIVPLVAIWLTAFYGYAKLKDYAVAIEDSTEGAHLTRMAHGLMFLVFSLPFSGITGSILNFISWNVPAYEAESTIARNLINLIFPLIAFYWLGTGAERLAGLVKKKAVMFDHRTWTIGFIIFSSLFVWLVVANHGDGNGSVYQLPGWLVVTTLAIPYLCAWYFGLLGAYCLYYYRTHVKGVLYRQALKYFSAGLAVVVGVSVSIQLLTTVSERLNRLDLTPILLIVYVLVCCYAVGYGLIAKGAKKLKTIEDV